jgi:translation initiation factor IF-2
MSRGGKKSKHATPEEASATKAIKKRIKIQETISIGDFAHRMGVKVAEVIAKLMGLGVMATVNQSLDVDTATLVATEFGYEVEQALTEEISIVNLEVEESGGEMEPRPPVVTVMGHVDHGKTSILDAIRNTDVAVGEAGGITQHIGAHYVRSTQGDVVFLDTPGHAAFTEMRSRGAKVTDIVVLVVAADDGVMDQTKEAINHAKAADVPIVVAINKIDKEGADSMRVKRELAEFELTPEEWGGSTIYCETSAKKNIGIEELLEQILLQAEILELKADKKRKARGRVIEAKIHRGRGPVATILVQQGTLKAGDCFVVGEHYGRVKSLLNDKGKKIKEAGPSWPVEVQGLNGVPRAGDDFVVVNDEKMAKSVSAQRAMKNRESQLGQATKISLDNLFDKLQEGNVKELKVLLRSDVQGTLEAFGKALEKLGTDEIKVKIIHEGTGTIIDSDVLLAAASEAIIIGFNVRPSTKVQEFAAKESVDIRYYDVIYNALDDIRNAMTGLLEPVFQERVIGSLEVRSTFVVPKIGTIAGCYVTDGKIERNAKVRLVRDGVVVNTGKISSLRRFKDDVKEVAAGYECGVGLENYNDIKENDVLEVFVMDQIAAKL